MPLIPIEDLADVRIAAYRSLKTTNETRWSETFVVEGEKLVRRLLESEFETLHVLIGDSYVERMKEIFPAELPVYVIPTKQINDLIGFHFHRGILACGKRKPSPALTEMLEKSSGKFCCAICPNVTDPENLGAIIRISAGFGVDLLLLGKECGDPFSRRVQRVSMGNNLKLPIIQTERFEEEIRTLKGAGVELLATVLDPEAEVLNEVRCGDRFAVMFGNEGEGLSAEWVARADRRVTIPMRNGTDSLNVAVAAGIFLYHFTSRG